MSALPLVVGIDAAKAQLDIARRPTGEPWVVANDDTGMATTDENIDQAIQKLKGCKIPPPSR